MCWRNLASFVRFLAFYWYFLLARSESWNRLQFICHLTYILMFVMMASFRIVLSTWRAAKFSKVLRSSSGRRELATVRTPTDMGVTSRTNTDSPLQQVHSTVFLCAATLLKHSSSWLRAVGMWHNARSRASWPHSRPFPIYARARPGLPI